MQMGYRGPKLIETAQDILNVLLDGNYIPSSSKDTDYLIDNIDKFVRLLCNNNSNN